MGTDLLTTSTSLEAAITSNQRIFIPTLGEYAFGVRRGKWPGIFRTNGLSALCELVLSPVTGPKKSKERLQNTGSIAKPTIRFC